MALGHGSVNNSSISGRGEQLVAVMYNAVATNISCSKEQLDAAINSVTSTKFILLTQFDHRLSINKPWPSKYIQLTYYLLSPSLMPSMYAS